ncbi:2-oxo-4-hydroxy-4-carboxy-5-ureidoimidazoline decarboxylase [Oscillatoria sp. FACHB-1407]|uniref:2-oxo-4-hydroxy-4-carboxy-5-ureidoimidazoline decarboxylase n=1 Tax=Oscillatoria sp. FACHB-1407 TaxID=2692847 RepID=UPI00168658D4|nr:2-oxo-4-hydroxy-4-carboxy-5-ureidoimidazoline decarboxylase [Oscillatoria sp. FACHB-1407]MBD2461545.1 2-oxo-4-hydroxy-4-carboxy-5-ureidoimidazoline decarboxylase [Oscillatoria sp. FACHB-1407]
MSYSIADLNAISQTDFVAAIGDVFEHTPAIAATVWNHRPFNNVNHLHQTLVMVMHQLSRAEQLALIQAHPDLGSKAKMAEASVQEQIGAGLNHLTPDEYERFLHLNQAYKDKFGFPFIIAVRHHTKASILEAFDRRLLNSVAVEMQQALTEIAEIARFRLLDRVIA